MNEGPLEDLSGQATSKLELGQLTGTSATAESSDLSVLVTRDPYMSYRSLIALTLSDISATSCSIVLYF